MPHLRSVILAQCILVWGVLVACNQQPTPSLTQSAEETALTAEQATDGTEMAKMPESTASGGELASNMEELDPDHFYADGSHRDHDSKHGGTFFMSLDNYHHLEGVLERPGVFRVYVYDAHTQPVSREQLEQTQAKVIWGDIDGAPEIDLKPSADGSCLEAPAPGPVRFPVTLTLLSRFPGTSPGSRSELFTFPFSHYSHIDTTPHTH
ncbi:MAG: hypothetical protein HYX73_01645 [Acidobacteria bacterium]|nr:hypothetical protein [Acidobacteriota bacterium]